MRVSSSMLRGQVLNTLMDSQSKLLIIQQQLSSTKEVSKSSDHPTRFDRVSRLKSLLARNDKYLENIEDGLGWSQTGASSLDIIYETLDQIKHFTERTRNDVDQFERPQTAEAVEGLLEEMVILGNARYLGRYIFGGTITSDPAPFDFDGTTITFSGNDNVIERKVGKSAYLDINVSGNDFRAVLDAALAIRDALLLSDGPTIDAALLEVEEAQVKILNTITRAGTQQRKLELTRENLEVVNINLKSYISQTEDVDLTEALLEFNSKELGYRAALESTARIMNITILDYIR